MDNTINSLVNNFAVTAGTANPGSVKDYQGKTYDSNQLLALSKQVAGSIDANAIKGGVFSTKGESVGFNYDEATKLLGHPPTAAEQVILDMSRHLLNEGVTDLTKVDASDTNRRFGSTYTGGGGTIYEIKKDADGKPVISSWSKDTSDKKTILTGLAIAAAAFGIPGVTEGLLSSAPAGSTLASVATEAGSLIADADIAGGLIPSFGTNAAADAFMTSAMTPEAIASLGATVAAAPEVIGSGNALTTAAAGTKLADVAKTGLLGLTTADALALQTGGTLLGGLVNKNAVSNASDIINQAGVTGAKTLSDVYADQKAANVANNLALTNANTALGTSLNTNLTNQIGKYDTANTNINANATNELATLKTNLANQTAQANANASALNANYGATRGDLYDIYNKQVGIQQPYQDIGKQASKDILANDAYFQHQFDVNDLNSQLAPNYAFQLQQGQMANQRAANMGGGSIGGNALQGLQKYTQDYASGAYQNAFNNYNTQRQNIFSTLRDMANIGTTSGGQLASLGNTLGGNLGSLSSNLGSNLTSNTGNLINAGNAYGSNTAGVTNNLNNVLSSNLNTLQGAYNQYGSNLTSAANNLGSNLTTGAGQVINAGNVYGTNQTGLTTGLAAANAQNQVAGANVVGTTLNNLGNTALLSSLIKAT